MSNRALGGDCSARIADLTESSDAPDDSFKHMFVCPIRVGVTHDERYGSQSVNAGCRSRRGAEIDYMTPRRVRDRFRTNTERPLLRLTTLWVPNGSVRCAAVILLASMISPLAVSRSL